MNIFEKASRVKMRFDSGIGLLTVEQLWDLPLVSKQESRPTLDGLARHVHSQLKGLEEGSFVELRPDPPKGDLETRLEILKHIIKVRLDEKAAAEKAAQDAERKRKLLGALASKEEAELTGMTREQLEAEIAKLGG